jgi:sugar lactone lactonase YvrE
VRRHAKASSAGSISGQASSLAAVRRGALATRASSLSPDGSGAPSRQRARLSLAALTIAALALLALAPLSQAKVVVDGFGTLEQGSGIPLFGGQFSNNTPRGTAVNNSGVGAAKGTVYVVDNGSRIQRFSPTGTFERAFGQDVIATTVNERQRVDISASGGTFTLSFKGFTTDPIPFNADPSNDDLVRNALAALPSVNGVANVADAGNKTNITGGIKTGIIIAFQGALGASDQPLVTVDPSGLTGTASVSPVVDGANSATTGGSSTGFEICTVAAYCQAGSTSGTTANGGQLNSPQGIAVNQSNGHVYVTESGNARVSEFDADGNFVRAFGWDVVTTGGTGDVSTDAFEVCTVAADCKQGASGTNGGEFSTTLGYPVVDGSGNVWVPDAGNNRIEEFDSTGNFIAAYGYGVNGGAAVEKCISTTSGVCQAGTSGSAAGQFSFGSPTQIAFDSSGNLYAIDSGNNRVQKFDPTIVASVSDFGTSTFPTYTTQAPGSLVSTSGGTRLVFSVSNDVSGNGERQLLELDPTDASVKDTSLVGSGLSNVNGLGVDTTSGNLYATTTHQVFPQIPPPRVLKLSSTPLANSPAIALSPVLVKGETYALLKGTVDPKGGLVSCAFEYSTDQKAWNSVAEPDCAGLGENGGIQAVGEAVLGLTPATHYFARLSVSRPLVPNSTITSSVQQFDTVAPAPAVSVVGAYDIQDTTVRMSGTIDPKNSATGYVFEYGTTPALGQSTAPVDIGGGTTPKIVSQQVGGLTPDTTYYFRLKATNASGSTANPTLSFHTRADAIPLPDNRAYEMVSPPDKNGGDADRVNILPTVLGLPSPDGEKVAFCTNAVFGEDPPQVGPDGCTAYLSSRTSGGWETKSLMPHYCYANPTTGQFTLDAYEQLDLNFDRSVVAKAEPAGCPIPPLDPAAPFSTIKGSGSLYLQDLSGDKNDPSSFRLLAPQAISGTGVDAGSADFSHIFFRSVTNQTASPDSPAQAAFDKIYEWVEPGPDCGIADPSYRPALGACLRLASVKPDGTPFTVNSNYPPVSAGAGANFTASDAVSRDGRRLYFQSRTPTLANNGSTASNPACSVNGVDCQLYMREDGATTFQVSKSECTVGCDPIDKASTFVWATSDGSVVLFTSCDKLTNNAVGDGTSGSSCQIYRWDRNQPSGARLTSLGYLHSSEEGVMGVSDDGDTVYTYDDDAIRRWQWNGGSPTVDVLASTVGAPSNDLGFTASASGNRTTPDGKYLLTTTVLPLDQVVDKDTDRDLYRWDEENGWICLSCQPPGVASKGNADNGTKTAVTAEGFGLNAGLGFRNQQPLMSPDGKRVLFTTPDALVPEDTNGEAGCPLQKNKYACSDVYEWNDGRVSLISSGKSSTPSYLMGADWSNGADNVFFYTRDRLVGWDVDNGTDIYDARVGGGFPEPPPTGAPCEGEACRGAGTSPSNTPGAGSGVFQGPGNPPAKHNHPKKKHPKKKHHHKRAHHRAAKHNRRAAR